MPVPTAVPKVRPFTVIVAVPGDVVAVPPDRVLVALASPVLDVPLDERLRRRIARQPVKEVMPVPRLVTLVRRPSLALLRRGAFSVLLLVPRPIVDWRQTFRARNYSVDFFRSDFARPPLFSLLTFFFVDFLLCSFSSLSFPSSFLPLLPTFFSFLGE